MESENLKVLVQGHTTQVIKGEFKCSSLAAGSWSSQETVSQLAPLGLGTF